MSIKEEVIRYKVENPCLSTNDISKKVNRTRQAVWSILNKAGVDTTYKRILDPEIPIVCSECNNIFYRKQGLVIHQINKDKQELFFCGNRCKCSYMGKMYGWGQYHKTNGHKV